MWLDPAVRQEAPRALVARGWTKRQVLRRPVRGLRRGSLRSRPVRTSRRRGSRGVLSKETRMMGARVECEVLLVLGCGERTGRPVRRGGADPGTQRRHIPEAG